MKTWYHETNPDVSVGFAGEVENPIVTMTRENGERLQIIGIDGVWVPVLLEDKKYRTLKTEELTDEIKASVEWAYEEISQVPPDGERFMELEVAP